MTGRVSEITGTIDGPGGPAYRLLLGDVHALSLIASGSVHVVVVSVPYYQLRDYGFAGQIGLEETQGSSEGAVN